MADSLKLETLIRPVSTMLLDNLHLLEIISGSPLLEPPQHLQDLPGGPQLKDAPPLQHHCQSPLLPTPTTEDMEAQVIAKLIPDPKLDKDKSSVNETSHLYTLTDTHSCIDKANSKSGPIEDIEDKKPRNATAPHHKNTFDKPEITLITDELPDTAPDNPSIYKSLTYYPFRRSSNLTDVPLDSTHAPNDDHNARETHEKESHPHFASGLHETNSDDSSTNLEKPKMEHTDLKEEEFTVDEEDPNPDESSLDDLVEPTHAPATLDLHETNVDDSSLKLEKSKYTNSGNTELMDLKEEESATESKNPKPIKSSLEAQKHSKSCKTAHTDNLTEDDPPNELETSYPNEEKEAKRNLIKDAEPSDKDDEFPSSPPKTNKSKSHTDTLDKPDLNEDNKDIPLNPLMTTESTSLTVPLQEAPNSAESANRSIPPG